MKTFQRKTAGRIAAVTLLMAACASPLAWLVSRENAEQEVVAFAQEESHRILTVQGSLQLDGPESLVQAQKAAQLLTGGLFEIAEIYDAAEARETIKTSFEDYKAKYGQLTNLFGF